MGERAALVCVPNEGEREVAPVAERSSRWRRRGRPGSACSGAPEPRPTPESPRRHRAVWRGAALGALLGAAALGLTLALQAPQEDSSLSRRIAAGCEQLEACQALEAEAERRSFECRVFCDQAVAEHRAARLLRYRAEERRAVRAHYRERERVERLEQQREHARQQDERARREAARAQEAARVHERRLELERLRQAHFDRRQEAERMRRASYYASLGPEGRARRLERCLATASTCDALTLDLLDAASDDAERRALGELNEGVAPAGGVAAAPAESAPDEAKSRPNASGQPSS